MTKSITMLLTSEISVFKITVNLDKKDIWIGHQPHQEFVKYYLQRLMFYSWNIVKFIK